MPTSKSKTPIIIIIASLVIAFAMTAGTLAWKSYKSNVVEVKDDVVIYATDDSPYTITSSSDTEITVSSLDGLEEGAILTAGITEETPNGLLCKLGEPAPSDDGYTIPITQASFADVFKECNYTASAVMTEDGNYEIQESSSSSSSPIVEKAYAIKLANNFMDEDYGFINVSAGNSVDLNLKVERDENFKVSVIDNFYAGVKMDGTSGKLTLFDETLKPIEFKVGIVPVVIVPKLSMEADVSASIRDMTFEAGASVGRKVGFEYSTISGLSLIDEDSSTDPYVNHTPMSDDLKFKVNGGLTTKLQTTLYGIFGTEASVALRGDFDGRLKEVPAGEPTDGAISIPGSDKKYTGKLSEKITVPITGSIVVNAPDSVLSLLFAVKNHDVTNFNELARKELFDTGDLITLYDETQTFGQIAETYEINLGHGLPVFAIDYPEGWTVGPLDFDYPTGEMDFAAMMASHGGVTITCNDNPEASVGISFMTNYFSIAKGYNSITSATVERIADSSLASPGSDNVGDYCVAKITHTESPDEAKGNTVGFKETIFYAVVPNSQLGSGKAHWVASNTAVFPYGTWPTFPGHEFYLLVDSAELNAMTEDQRQEAIAMLESFRRL